MWFEIPLDYCRGRCATEGCYGVAAWRLEAGGVGSDYCGNCASILRKNDLETSAFQVRSKSETPENSSD